MAMNHLPNTHRRGKLLEGVVVSNRMQKTVVVRVDRRTKHSRYQKYITISKRYKVHHEGDPIRVGDRVVIQETRPLSKTKRWKIARRVLSTLHDSDTSKETVVQPLQKTSL